MIESLGHCVKERKREKKKKKRIKKTGRRNEEEMKGCKKFFN
jgi:hypothetical protein